MAVILTSNYVLHLQHEVHENSMQVNNSYAANCMERNNAQCSVVCRSRVFFPAISDLTLKAQQINIRQASLHGWCCLKIRRWKRDWSCAWVDSWSCTRGIATEVFLGNHSKDLISRTQWDEDKWSLLHEKTTLRTNRKLSFYEKKILFWKPCSVLSSNVLPFWCAFTIVYNSYFLAT